MTFSNLEDNDLDFNQLEFNFGELLSTLTVDSSIPISCLSILLNTFTSFAIKSISSRLNGLYSSFYDSEFHSGTSNEILQEFHQINPNAKLLKYSADDKDSFLQ